MKNILLMVLGACGLAAACSSSPTTGDGGTPDATNDVTQGNDGSPNDVATNDVSNDSSTNDAATDSTSDAGTATLTIKNYLAWCSVTVNGGTPNTTATQTYHLPLNSTVTAHGDTKNSSAFYWGYWGNVGSDGGLDPGGEDTSMDISFVITGDLTLDACCPDNGQPLTQCTF